MGTRYLVFKSKETYIIPMGLPIYLFAYVKIIGKEIHLKTDVTRGEYMLLDDFIIRSRSDKIGDLAQLKINLESWDLEQITKYIIDEFDKMGYKKYGECNA